MSEQCAYHEAGHALMAHLLGAQVASISIDPEFDDEALRHDGEIEIIWPAAPRTDKRACIAVIQVALAGPAAEMVHTGEPYHPALVREWSQDWKFAWTTAEQLARDNITRMRILERTTADVYRLMKRDDHWQALASLVDSLVAHEHLDGWEVHEILATWIGSI